MNVFKKFWKWLTEEGKPPSVRQELKQELEVELEPTEENLKRVEQLQKTIQSDLDLKGSYAAVNQYFETNPFLLREKKNAEKLAAGEYVGVLCRGKNPRADEPMATGIAIHPFFKESRTVNNSEAQTVETIEEDVSTTVESRTETLAKIQAHIDEQTKISADSPFFNMSADEMMVWLEKKKIEHTELAKPVPVKNPKAKRSKKPVKKVKPKGKAAKIKARGKKK